MSGSQGNKLAATSRRQSFVHRKVLSLIKEIFSSDRWEPQLMKTEENALLTNLTFNDFQLLFLSSHLPMKGVESVRALPENRVLAVCRRLIRPWWRNCISTTECFDVWLIVKLRVRGGGRTERAVKFQPRRCQQQSYSGQQPLRRTYNIPSTYPIKWQSQWKRRGRELES